MKVVFDCFGKDYSRSSTPKAFTKSSRVKPWVKARAVDVATLKGLRKPVIEPFQGSRSLQIPNPGRCPGLFYSALSAQQGLHILGRSTQHRASAALDDGPLNQVRMLDQQRNDLIVAEVLLPQTELAIDRLAGAEEFARLDAHLPDQLAQVLFAERLKIVIDLRKRNATLTEQLVGLTTLRSSRLFVDGDLIANTSNPWAWVFGDQGRKTVYGKLPRTRVASATRSTASM